MQDERTTALRTWSRRAAIGGGIAAAGAAAVGLGVLASRDGARIVRGISRARAVKGDTVLPQRADVVVIGGGNIGCMTALTLAERGVSVALCEKGVIAGEASGRSLGYIDSVFLDPVKLESIHRSKLLWQDMNVRVQGDTGYRRTGLMILFTGQDGIGASEAWLDSVKGRPGVDGRILSAREAAALATGSSTQYAGALFQPSDAIAEPQLAAPAMADAVRRHGGKVFQGCAVRGLETTAGRISGVVTEHGPIACGSVVLAGGAWSPVFARSLGLDLPQFMAFSGVTRLAGKPDQGPAVPLISEHSDIVMRRTRDGAYDTCRAIGITPVTPSVIAHLPRLRAAWTSMGSQIRPVLNLSTFMREWRMKSHWALDERSPFEDNRILQPETRTSFLDEVAGATRAEFPSAGRVIERWSGALTSTIDNMPVLSPVDAVPGLFIGSGFYYGLAMATVGGEALADLVMHRKPQIDLSLFRFARFSDGSPLVFRG